jgi:hypothetical protein
VTPPQDASQRTVAHTAAAFSSTEAFVAVLDLLKKKNVANAISEESDHPKAQEQRAQGPRYGPAAGEGQGTSSPHSSLQFAGATWSWREPVLERGGVEAPKKDEDENVYEGGLDVGGKKMDWALEVGFCRPVDLRSTEPLPSRPSTGQST